MSGSRRAALCLHGLEDSDKHWLLQSLSTGQRQQLEGMLEELEQIGIPKGQRWFPELMHESPPVGKETSRDHVDNLSDQIDSVSAERISELLEHEPVCVITALLSYRNWTWRQAYLSKQYVQKKQRLIQEIERYQDTVKPKVMMVLLGSLAKRLESGASYNQLQSFDKALHHVENQNMKGTQRSRWKALWQR